MAVKKTVLELVQDILFDLNSDEVNSINDTEDSEQVARHLRATYNAIINKDIWPHTLRALTLDARSDSNYPTHMIVQEDVRELVQVEYNASELGETRRRYKEVDFVDHEDFMRKTVNRNNDEDNVDVIVDDSGIELLIRNDKAPAFYTSFDDTNLIFDSYDSAVDSTLRVSKFRASGYILPEFLLEDTFVPDLPADAFSFLQEEATSRAQFKMRQIVDSKSEAESSRQRRMVSRRSWVAQRPNIYPNYGRRK